MQTYEDNPVDEKDLYKIRKITMSPEERAIAEAIELAKGNEKAMYLSGREDAIKKVAKNMLKDNVDISIIKKYTGLSEREIKSYNVSI
ncbi:MAG: hypothetical protein IJU40_00505, partial [Desulfovibrionaceae bacterium]|nr:hypothetical protein [Desulfovibrionaceae bacterium]